MESFVDKALAAPGYLKVTGGTLLFLLLVFLVFFLVPAFWHWIRLYRIQRRLSRLDKTALPDEYPTLFNGDRALIHLWNEYSETLHEQKGIIGGLTQTLAWRATVPAEAYFNTQYVVDSRLRTEFFKHLPGIFTGIGIIGTFSGLIAGLSKFKPTPDPAQTVAMIGPLIDSVGEAFLVSACAITAAMVVTFLEKLLVAALYRRTEEISQGIDARFDAGAGEEYLSRLVSASEDSASQAKILKDALVSELGDILREISHAQMSAFQSSQAELGSAISNSIKTGLTEPLNRMEETFKTVTGGTGERTVQMLGDVMASFSDRLNNLFGSQISGINELNRQSAQTMQEAVAALNVLVGQLGEQGKQATAQMATQMAESIQAMERRQADIDAKTELSLRAVSEQMSVLMQSLSASYASTLAANREREGEMASRTSSMVEGLTGNIDAVIQEMTKASQAMAGSVDRLSSTTTASIDKMNLGAEKITMASSQFTAAGSKVAEVMDKAATVSGRLAEVSGQLVGSSNALQESLRDYQNQRQAIVALLEHAESTIELARREASITEDVLKRIEASSAKLSDVQTDFGEYLDGVSAVLAKSSQAFQEAVTSTLQRVNGDFHDQLDRAVKLLKSSIEEFGETLENAGSGH